MAFRILDSRSKEAARTVLQGYRAVVVAGEPFLYRDRQANLLRLPVEW